MMYSQSPLKEAVSKYRCANDLLLKAYLGTPIHDITLPINLNLILSKIENVTVTQSISQKKWNVLAEIDACYTTKSQVLAVKIWVNQSQARIIRRFSVAKAIGYIILSTGHRFQNRGTISRLVKAFNLGEKNCLIEKHAERFATQLLIPKSVLKREVDKTLGSIKRDKTKPELKDVINLLAKDFDVSNSMMEHRLRELGYIRW